MKLFDVAVAALAILPLATAQIDGLAACTQQCYGDLVAKGASLGCPDGADACLCGNQLFQGGIQDCASQLCPSQDPTVQVTEEVNKVKAYCTSLASQTPAADPSPTPIPTPSQEAPSPPPSEVPPSAPAESATVPITDGSPSTQVASPSPSPADPVESGQTTGQADPTATSPNSSNASPTTDTSASGAGAVKTGAANPDTAKAEESSQDNSGSGLSTTAKIGIGAGVGGGALLVILIVATIMCRRRRKPLGRKISDPLPGSGRYKRDTPPRMAYTFAEKNTSDLEMTSRRYEDMLPRQQPRQMV